MSDKIFRHNLSLTLIKKYRGHNFFKKSLSFSPRLQGRKRKQSFKGRLACGSLCYLDLSLALAMVLVSQPQHNNNKVEI